MLSWIANLLIVIGLWKIASKDRTAFIFSIAGETLWMVSALLRPVPDYALASICAVFNVMAMRSFIKWGKS